MDTLFLSMRHINKQYTGVKALDDVEFSIREGEIHCLAGTNGSGKSTLVKIISGVEQPEAGAQIEIAGEPAGQLNSMDSIRHGIEVIYQDLSLFPNLSVQENIAMSELVSSKTQWVSWKKAHTIAVEAMDKIGVSIPLDQTVSRLSMADRQLVAICRALTKDVRLLIMDEPTTALTKKEVDALLSVVVDLKKKGIATLFISHKLNEVMQVAERVTVLRDGVKIGCYPSSELDDKKIEYYMTGTTTVYTPYHVMPDTTGAPVLELDGLSKEGNFKDISMSVYPGEIVGITGLLGSGRTELALSIFGLNPPDEGTMRIDGEPVVIDTVKQAVSHGIAYVPENRLVEGLVLDQSVGKNVVMTVLDRMLTASKCIDVQQVDRSIARWVRELKIKVPSVDSAVKTLSGGNQQRVVLAKWIATEPKLFILDNPTVGIDIAAKTSIHEVIKHLAAEGVGVIIISDEIAEVLYTCNRVLVMNRGRILKQFISSEANEEEIQRYIESHAV
ncbi:MAG: sugar ABC transporter ATP-binding protein [Spirochaetia bacterium]|nr:sugar ABC transporter ATP-binding protein [Spirochaetia bacterium]